MSGKTIQMPGLLFREVRISGEGAEASIDTERRTVELSFSSELPVRQWYGLEILDHGKSSVDLARLKNAAPLLVNHNRDDLVGVVEKAWIRERRGFARVRFGKSNRAQEIWQDVQDGLRTKISVGYRVAKMKLEEHTDSEENGGIDSFRVTEWEPYEISLASIPADDTVGVGRAQNVGPYNINVENYEPAGQRTSDQPIEIQHDYVTKDTVMSTKATIEPVTAPTAVPEPQPDLEAVRSQATATATSTERNRVNQLTQIVAQGERLRPDIGLRNLLVEHIGKGTSVEDFGRMVLERTSNAGPLPVAKPADPAIGMSQRDIRRYSIVEAIESFANNQFPQEYRDLSDEVAKRHNRQPGSFWVPFDVLQAPMIKHGQRTDLSVGTNSVGGYITADNLLASSFIEVLRNRMVVAQLGATVLDGLVGDVLVPKQLTAGSATWATEAQSVAGTNFTVGQVTLQPKACTALMNYSTKLLAQATPSVEQLVRSDLSQILAIAQDLAALHGVGSSGQPTGVAATTGIGLVTIGTNGGAATHALATYLEREVAVDNADVGSLAYVTNPKVRAAMKTIERSTAAGDFIMANDGTVNGYRCAITNQVSAVLTKGTSDGVCSALFFGNWRDLIIAGWGGLDVLVDPYTLAAYRQRRIVATLYTDIGVRHAESFSWCNDLTT